MEREERILGRWDQARRPEVEEMRGRWMGGMEVRIAPNLQKPGLLGRINLYPDLPLTISTSITLAPSPSNTSFLLVIFSLFSNDTESIL